MQKLDSESLRRQLIAILRRQVTDPGPYESPEHAAKLLFQKEAVLVFDLADPQSFGGYSAHHPSVQSVVKMAVHGKKRESRTASQTTGIFGEPVYDLSSRMPEITLPVLGNVKLRSLNKQRPCQTRYARIEAETCPVGEAVTDEMAGALRWLSDPVRRRRTWQDVSGTCGFTKRAGKRVPLGTMLFAYPSQLGPDPPELAELFGGEDDSSNAEGAKFEECAARVVPALDGIVKEHPNSEINVFVLLKRDKARTRVVVSQKHAARQLIECAKSWQEGARNLPRVALNLGTERNPMWATELTPFPSELVECLNVMWLRDASRAEAVHALDIAAVISLLVDSGDPAKLLASRVLALAIKNATPLLMAMGHADHRRDGKVWITGKYPKHRRLLPRILGLLLFKLGSMKGEYMHQAPFLVGRMLSLADTLHKEYCIHHRKDVPSQLIGNATMGVALDNPVSALARLAERLPVYQSWANTTDREKGWAGWALAEMGKVSPELAEVLKSEPCDELAKAQMLLGYLARPKSAEQSTGEPDEPQNEKETNDGQ